MLLGLLLWLDNLGIALILLGQIKVYPSKEACLALFKEWVVALFLTAEPCILFKCCFRLSCIRWSFERLPSQGLKCSLVFLTALSLGQVWVGAEGWREIFVWKTSLWDCFWLCSFCMSSRTFLCSQSFEPLWNSYCLTYIKCRAGSSHHCGPALVCDGISWYYTAHLSNLLSCGFKWATRDQQWNGFYSSELSHNN